MFNILLDQLPEDYKGYPIHSDFRTGIQITQVMDDVDLSEREKAEMAAELLFGDFEGGLLPSLKVASEGVGWFLSGWYTDNKKKKSENRKPVTDYDRDQWRIYSAFLAQYNINLNTANLHYWEFMALLSTLDECAYTRIIDIRTRKVNPKASPESKKALMDAKEIYGLETPEERETALEKAEREAIAEDFMKKLGM